MRNDRGQISFFYGDAVENAAEAACLRRLRRDLAAQGIAAVLLANLTLGPKQRQIDLIVATEATAVVVELKGYVHAVQGGMNGPWMLELGNRQTRRLGSTNPYQQALANRYAVTDSLGALLGIDSNTAKNAVTGMLCLFPVPIVGSRIPASDFKLTLGGYADLLGLLAAAKQNPLPLVEWRRFAQSLGLNDGSVTLSTDAETRVSQYLAAYTDLARATTGPYIEPKFENQDTTAALTERIVAGAQMQIVGTSGSGKTELMKAVARSTAHAGCLPILLRAGDFERHLAPLLQAAVARCSPMRPPTLFKAAARAGVEIILYVDGLNECPATRRGDLIAALQAARINYGARLVFTTQEPISLPTILSGEEIGLLQPDTAQSRRLVTAHLGRPLTDHELNAVEMVGTAHDAVVLAAVLETPANLDGRFALYHSFVQKRIEAASAAHVVRSLATLATAMRTSFLSSLPVPAAGRILKHNAPATIEIARVAGLIRIDENRLAFRHDLIADFFAAEDILRLAGNAAELNTIARQPINAELREFLLGGCATMAEIEALIGQAPDSRLLRAALLGRAGSKARNYVLSRLRDLIGLLAQRYTQVSLALPEGVASARELYSLIPSLPDEPAHAAIDKAYLNLLPYALSDGLLTELLNLFSSVDRRLVGEAQRLCDAHPNVRLAWQAAAYGTIYGMHHHHAGGRELQELLHAIQSAWLNDTKSAPDLALRSYLDAFETLSPGQLFLLVAALRRWRNEPFPSRFPELLQHIWKLKIYHLRLFICDIITFRGAELPPEQQQEIREALGNWLSNDNSFMNSIIFDALEAVEGIETTLTVEDAVQEYEAMLALPESPEACSLAVSAVTRTYDHPFRDIYWKAFYDALPVEKRQALLLRGLHDAHGDPWLLDDILRALHRDPTAAAAPELQKLAQIPMAESHSYQHALHVYADAIALLAKLAIPLAPPDPLPRDSTRRAWYRAAPLIYALNAKPATSQRVVAEVTALRACGAAEAFDVIQHLTREAHNIRHPANVAFESAWPELVLDLCRTVLSPGYMAVSLFEHIYFRTLADDHVDLALALMAKVGRSTDVALVSTWLNHARHGERALETARALERRAN